MCHDVSMPESVPNSPPHVVLVHGAWHGAWCYSALQAELDRRGVASYAVDLPGHGVSGEAGGDLATDALALRSALRALAGRGVRRVILVGHSYGGAVISQYAGNVHSNEEPEVEHLIFLAAFALADGESVISALGSFPHHDVDLSAAIMSGPEGHSVLDATKAIPALYGSCDRAAASAAVARLTSQPMATMTQAIERSPLGDIQSTYVVCSLDRAVHPDHQQIMANRCDFTFVLETDHSPFLSMTKDTADIISHVMKTSVTS